MILLRLKMRSGTETAHTAFSGLLAAVMIFAANFGAFVGTRSIPWDFRDLHYTEYITALLAAHHNIFETFDPYQLGGIFLPNLFAYYDPLVWWFPLLTNGYPDLYQHQLMLLLHVFVVPASLFYLAYLYGVRGKRFYPVAALSLVAVYLGPTVQLISQGGELQTYIWGFAITAALESYRITGKRFAMVAAAVFVSWAMIASNEDLPFWPLALLAYAIAFWPELSSRRRFLFDLPMGILIAVVLMAPFFMLEYGLYQSVLVTKQHVIVETARAANRLAYFGYNDGLSMFVLPGSLMVILVASLGALTKRARWILGITLAALYVYALGNITPFEGIFRGIYYPASLFRRPYCALDIALPLTFAIVVRGYFAVAASQLAARSWILAGTAIAFVAALIVQPNYALLTLFAFVLTVTAILSFRSRAIVTAVLVAQWCVAVFIPFRTSEFYPGAWPPPQLQYFNGYTSVAKYMSPITTDSRRLFRVAGFGTPGDLNSDSGVYQYYMLYPGHSTLLPQSLATLLKAPEIQNDLVGTRNLTAESIVDTVAARPNDMVGSSAVRQMATRYYITGPNAASILPTIRRSHPEFKTFPGGYWTVLYDPLAEPFVRMIDESGKTSEVSAVVDWGYISAPITDGAHYLDVANLYDPWWHAYSSSGDRLAVINHDGELRVLVSGHVGPVTLRFENRWFMPAMILELLAYCAVLLGLFVQVTRAFRKRRARREELVVT